MVHQDELVTFLPTEGKKSVGNIMQKLNIIDMFYGGGGESTGLISAAHDYDFDVNMRNSVVILDLQFVIIAFIYLQATFKE